MAETTPTTTTTNTQTTDGQQTTPEQQNQPTTPALFDEGGGEQGGNTDGQQQTTPEQTQGQEQPPETPQTLKAEDITLPEGYEYDQELGNSFLGILNEAKIGKETAQKLFDLYQSQQVKMLEGLKAADSERMKKFEADLATEKAEWLKQCQADKEYGGQNWDAAQAVIDKGCKQLATPEAVKLMQAYNLNTHPEIVRMFYRAGKLAGEDNSQINGSNNARSTDPAMAIFGDSLKDYYKRRNGN